MNSKNTIWKIKKIWKSRKFGNQEYRFEKRYAKLRMTHLLNMLADVLCTEKPQAVKNKRSGTNGAIMDQLVTA